MLSYNFKRELITDYHCNKDEIDELFRLINKINEKVCKDLIDISPCGHYHGEMEFDIYLDHVEYCSHTKMSNVISMLVGIDLVLENKNGMFDGLVG